MIILIVDILTAMAAFVFIIYGLQKAVDDRDDIMIFVGTFIQIGVIAWMTSTISRLFDNNYIIILIVPLALLGIFPVMKGVKDNEVLPSEMQINLRSPIEKRKTGRFIPLLRPERRSVYVDDGKEEWEETHRD